MELLGLDLGSAVSALIGGLVAAGTVVLQQKLASRAQTRHEHAQRTTELMLDARDLFRAIEEVLPPFPDDEITNSSIRSRLAVLRRESDLIAEPWLRETVIGTCTYVLDLGDLRGTYYRNTAFGQAKWLVIEGRHVVTAYLRGSTPARWRARSRWLTRTRSLDRLFRGDIREQDAAAALARGSDRPGGNGP